MTAHGTPLTDVFNSLNPADVANWPEGGFITDTSIFNPASIGSKTISDQDSYVEYWDGDPNRLSGRTNPMGIKVQQRSLAFNAPFPRHQLGHFRLVDDEKAHSPTSGNPTPPPACPPAGWSG
mgnify:CR=1 FL=1